MSLPDWVPADDESVVWAGQPRRRVVLQGGLAGLVGAAVAIVGAVVAVRTGVVSTPVAAAAGGTLALVAFAVPTAAMWLWRRTTHYLLTENALYHRTGVLSLTVTELRLTKVQNTTYSQGVLGTLFDHGTVTVDTAGSQAAELTLRALDGPGAVHQRIAARVGDAADRTGDGVPGSLARWQSVRDEVTRLRRALDAE